MGGPVGWGRGVGVTVASYEEEFLELGSKIPDWEKLPLARMNVFLIKMLTQYIWCFSEVETRVLGA